MWVRFFIPTLCASESKYNYASHIESGDCSTKKCSASNYPTFFSANIKCSFNNFIF